MKFKDGTFEFKNGIFISVWQNLTEIFKMKQFNWNTFQFILVEFENDRAMHDYEFTLVLLCCGIRIRVPVFPKEEHPIHKEVYDSLKSLKESCYGWCNTNAYKRFKNKQEDRLIVLRTRQSGIRKKIFIQ
jgi:hypothetical protein